MRTYYSICDICKTRSIKMIKTLHFNTRWLKRQYAMPNHGAYTFRNVQCVITVLTSNILHFHRLPTSIFPLNAYCLIEFGQSTNAHHIVLLCPPYTSLCIMSRLDRLLSFSKHCLSRLEPVCGCARSMPQS